MARSPVVLSWVQHLHGIGHVFRATRIARALAEAGARVHLAWGGTRIPSIDLAGLDVTFLEPVRTADARFQDLVRPDGSPADEALKARRRDALLELFARVRPDIVITEAYPFGRRQMRFEVEPLMQAARAASWRPLTVASIRDIMQENRAEKRVAESLDAVREFFDLVLVHGDPALIPIGATLQGAGEIADRIRHTGLVAPPPPDLSVPPSFEADVVVAAGGGAFGQALTAAARAAFALCPPSPRGWLVVAGPERDAAEFAALAAAAPPGLKVVRFVPDLARVFAAAEICITMAGYNTVGDLIQAKARAVLVPYTGGRETEQIRRAEIFAQRGLAVMLPDRELSPHRLAGAIAAAEGLPRMDARLDTGGAENSARILITEWQRKTGLQ